jgi:hypothetical protein
MCGCTGVSMCLERVALIIQHETLIGYIVICDSFGPSYFATLTHKHHDFRKTKLEKENVFSFPLQLLFVTFLILRIIQPDVVINLKKSLHVKYLLFFTYFN